MLLILLHCNQKILLLLRNLKDPLGEQFLIAFHALLGAVRFKVIKFSLQILNVFACLR